MNKKLLMFTLIPLALLVMVAPVMAKPIGPRKSNNPRIEINEVTGEVGHFLPNGGMHSWMADTELMAFDFMHCLNASQAKGLNNTATTVKVGELAGWMDLIMNYPEDALEALKNKWFYLPYDTLVLMMILEGEDPAMAEMWPDGMYCRFVNVGPTWDA